MFEASTIKFVKSVGKGSLQPAPTIDEAPNCRPFHVIVKKYRKWPWQSPTFEPTPFTLSQLTLEQDKPLEKDLKVTTTKALTYNKIHKLNVNGKIGAQIKAILDVELDGSDSVDVEAKFGSVEKHLLDETSLMTAVMSRHLDINHEYIKQVRQHPRKALGVVVASYNLAAGGTVTAEKTISGEEKIDEEKTAKILAGGVEDLKVGDTNNKTIVLPPGTAIAYRMLELRVKSDKSLHLVMENDLKGGFDDGDQVDGACSAQDHMEPEVKKMFAALIEMDPTKRGEFTSAVLHMCKFPKDIDAFLVLIKKAAALANEAELSHLSINKDTHVCILKDKFLCADKDWTAILKTAGFNFIDDGTVEYPKASAVYLDPIVCVYKGLIELDDEQLEAFGDLSAEYAKPLIYLLSQTIEKKPVQISDSELALLYTGEQNVGQSFLQTLEFQVDADGKIVPPDDSESCLHGASRAIYGLFWERSYDATTSHWCRLL